MRPALLLALLAPTPAVASGGDLLAVAVGALLAFVTVFISMLLALAVAWIARGRATQGWVTASAITLTLGVLLTAVVGGGGLLIGAHPQAVLMVLIPGALSLLLAGRLHRQAKAALRAAEHRDP